MACRIGPRSPLMALASGWDLLVQAPAAEIQLPREVADLPLVAEYYERNAPVGWAALKHHLLGQFGRPAGGHHRRFAGRLLSAFGRR